MKRLPVIGLIVALLVSALLWVGRSTIDARSSEVEVRIGVELANGRLADVFVSGDADSLVSVVLLHGCCGDRNDMKQLAMGLATRGVTAITLDWGGIQPNGFPKNYQDVACSLNALAAVDGPERLFVLGWSDGTLPAAVVSLAADAAVSQCPASAVAPKVSGFIGLSGFYGWPDQAAFEDGSNEMVEEFFAGQAEQMWDLANPYTYLGSQPEIAMLLLQSSEDALLVDGYRFATAALNAGHDVTVIDMIGADHQLALSPRGSVGRAMMDHIVDFVTAGP
jgi:acetyl esterase/lipase